MDPKETVKDLKDKLTPMLNGLTAKKMRITSPLIGHLKNENTIASYNVLDTTVMEVGLKKRGGQ